MSPRHSPDDAPASYQIRVRGALDPHWSRWFGDMTITSDADGSTLLAGSVADQAALYGLINRLRDLGLTLLLVARERTDEAG